MELAASFFNDDDGSHRRPTSQRLNLASGSCHRNRFLFQHSLLKIRRPQETFRPFQSICVMSIGGHMEVHTAFVSSITSFS